MLWKKYFKAGGYTAEFGGANAGIIKIQLKSGGPNINPSFEYITDNLTFKSRENRYNGEKNLGAYSYGYNDMTASFSGPLIGDHIKIFGLFENLFQADRNPRKELTAFSGTIANDITPGDKINLNYPGGLFLK